MGICTVFRCAVRRSERQFVGVHWGSDGPCRGPDSLPLGVSRRREPEGRR